MKNANPNFPQWMLDEVALCDLELVHPPRVILDIGANIGAYAARCAQKWPHARIHAYEPATDNFLALVGNTGNYLNVVCWQNGVRATGGEWALQLGDTGVVHSFVPGPRSTGKTETVNCLAAAALPAADLIKLDTEGLELEILTHLNLAPVTALVIEYHSVADRRMIKAILLESGFELVAESAQHGAENGQLKFARPGTYIAPAAAPTGDLRPLTAAKKIFVGICLCGSTPPASVHAIARFAAHPPLNASINFDPGGGSVYMARNEQTARFLKSDCTHLMFVDDDLIPSLADFERIASHDVPVVGGMYPIKMEGELKWCGNGFPGQPEALIEANGLQRVRYLGTGFLCIERSVIERVIALQRDEIEYTLDHPPYEARWHVWREAVRKTDDARPRLLTEDWLFCQLCLELGIPVYADTKVRLRHTGTATWPLQSQLLTSDLRPPTSA